MFSNQTMMLDDLLQNKLSQNEAVEIILTDVFDALQEKGYNPINQIVGYLLTEDPTYITNYNNARSMICKLDRDELMKALVHCYLFENS